MKLDYKLPENPLSENYRNN